MSNCLVNVFSRAHSPIPFLPFYIFLFGIILYFLKKKSCKCCFHFSLCTHFYFIRIVYHVCLLPCMRAWEMFACVRVGYVWLSVRVRMCVCVRIYVRIICMVDWVCDSCMHIRIYSPDYILMCMNLKFELGTLHCSARHPSQYKTNTCNNK